MMINLASDLVKSIRQSQVDVPLPHVGNKIKRDMGGKISSKSSLDIYNYYTLYNKSYKECMARFGVNNNVIAYHIEKHKLAILACK